MENYEPKPKLCIDSYDGVIKVERVWSAAQKPLK